MATWSTIAFQRGLAAISSSQRYGTAPIEIPNRRRSKSRPATSGTSSTSGGAFQNDSKSRSRSASPPSSCSHSGSAGQHGRPLTWISGAYSRPAGPVRRACRPIFTEAIDAPSADRWSDFTRWKNSKRTPRRWSVSYIGAITTSPMPAFIRQKIAPL